VIEIRRVRPEEYVDVGVVTASAWVPRCSIDDREWRSFRDRIADVASRDILSAVYIATEAGLILGSVTLETAERVGELDNVGA
jgi:hypothetical protein